jgi:chromosome partitioning protein
VAVRGGSPATLGACGAADLVIVPVILGTRELNVLEQTLDELSAYPLLLVPNWVPFTPPAPERPRLRQIAEKHHVRVTSSIIREYR